MLLNNLGLRARVGDELYLLNPEQNLEQSRLLWTSVGKAMKCLSDRKGNMAGE